MCRESSPSVSLLFLKLNAVQFLLRQAKKALPLLREHATTLPFLMYILKNTCVVFIEQGLLLHCCLWHVIYKSYYYMKRAAHKKGIHVGDLVYFARLVLRECCVVCVCVLLPSYSQRELSQPKLTKRIRVLLTNQEKKGEERLTLAFLILYTCETL